MRWATQRAFIHTEHLEFERWGLPLVHWHAFCRAIYKGMEGGEWEELYCHYRESSQAAAAKKPSESQKAKALWAMKAAWERSEEYYYPARKDDILGRTKIRPELWEEHLKNPLAALAKALKCLENPYWGWHVISQFVVYNVCRRNGFQHRWCEKFGKDVGWTPLGRRLVLPGPMGCGALAHIIQLLERPEEGRAARSISSSSRRSPLLLQRQCSLSPLFLRVRSRHVL